MCSFFTVPQTCVISYQGPVHTETRLAVYAKMLYRIGVSSRRIRRFRRVKLLLFETGSRVDKTENDALAFSCVQPICIFCETMMSSPHVSPLVRHRYVT